MAAPTRAQIEAVIAKPEFTVEINTGSGYSALTNSNVLSFSGRLAATNSVDNGFAFGTMTQMGATVETTTSIANWEKARLRIRIGFDGSDKIVVSEGVIVQRQRRGDFVIYTAEGFDYEIARSKIYTGVFYRRPIATKTTSTSNEDWQAGGTPGILNRICFTVGGRPLEQPAYATDPAFKFWYSFNDSITRPKFAWVSGDDAWAEMGRLVRAAGGQLYQDTKGVLRYAQPLTFGQIPSGTLYHFTPSTYASISEATTTAERIDVVKASYVERTLQPMQVVYDSDTPRLLAAGETVRMPLEMQYPVYTYADHVQPTKVIASGEGIMATYLDGRDASAGLSAMFHTKAAQLLDLSLTNLTSEPISVNRIVLSGRPVHAASEGVATYGSGTYEMILEDNLYVQNYEQAQRLVRMFYDFYRANRTIITLNDVGFDPDRYLGEVVELTYAPWSISAARYRIISIDYSNKSTMNVGLAPIAGLVTQDEVFIVGQTYATTDTRKYAY